MKSRSKLLVSKRKKMTLPRFTLFFLSAPQSSSHPKAKRDETEQCRMSYCAPRLGLIAHMMAALLCLGVPGASSTFSCRIQHECKCHACRWCEIFRISSRVLSSHLPNVFLLWPEPLARMLSTKSWVIDYPFIGSVSQTPCLQSSFPLF